MTSDQKSHSAAPLHYEHPLRAAAGRLVADYQGILAPVTVIAAITRAREQARDGYLLVFGDTPPPADEYVTIVIGLARQELALRLTVDTTDDIDTGGQEPSAAGREHAFPKPTRTADGDGWETVCSCGWVASGKSRNGAADRAWAHKATFGSGGQPHRLRGQNA